MEGFLYPRSDGSSTAMRPGLACIRTLRFDEQHLERFGSQVSLGSRVAVNPPRRSSFHVDIFRAAIGERKAHVAFVQTNDECVFIVVHGHGLRWFQRESDN